MLTRGVACNSITDHRSYTTAGTDATFPPPPSPLIAKRDHLPDHHQSESFLLNGHSHIHRPIIHLSGAGSHNNVDSSSLSWADQSYSSFNGSVSSMSTTKDSPNHSNRNSGSSTDSGRGVSTGQLDAKNGVVYHVTNAHRLSDQSYESGVSSRRSFHSTSSSSRGSLDRLEESSYNCPVVSVSELLKAGWSDEDAMLAWLRGLHFEEYYHNFKQAGYDMPTVSRMTPEDLTAIGVTKPAHRKRLKSEIARLHINDGIPDYRPDDLYDWLCLLRLEVYYKTLCDQGYQDFDRITDITWEDLEDIGIKMLGHQKKIMLAIDRLKRLGPGGKRQSNSDYTTPPLSNHLYPHWCEAQPSSQYTHEVAITTTKPRYPSSTDSSPTGSCRELSTFQHHKDHENSFQKEASPLTYGSSTAPTSRPHGDNGINRGAALTYGSSTASTSRPHGDNGINRGADSVFQEADSQSVVVKQKPIARIIAKRSSREESPDFFKYTDFNKEGSSERTTPTNMVNTGYRDTGYRDTGYKDTGYKDTGYKDTGYKDTQKSCEPVYDQPTTQNASKPLVFPKPRYHAGVTTAAITPLYIQTSYNKVAGASTSSPNDQCRKTPPPPPPKRTHSMNVKDIASLMDQKVAYVSGNRLPSPGHDSKAYYKMDAALKQPPLTSTSAPSIAPKPMTFCQTSAIPESNSANQNDKQPQSFSDCLKSLSAKFGSAKMERDDNNDGLNDSCHSSDSEDFPPPPPPLAMDIITPNYSILNKSNRDSPERFSQPARQQSVPANPLLNLDRLEKCRSPLHSSRNESPISCELTGSTTSVDSNTLPFANENVGTIKQKAAAVKASIVEFTGSTTGDREVNGGFFDGRCSTLKRAPMCQQTTQGATQGLRLYTNITAPSTPTHRTSSQSPAHATAPVRATHADLEQSDADSAGLLDDIGNMLQGLTDELDAMLVEGDDS